VQYKLTIRESLEHDNTTGRRAGDEQPAPYADVVVTSFETRHVLQTTKEYNNQNYLKFITMCNKCHCLSG
jgi:hypothetical protein